MRTPLFMALGSLLILGACATSTPYQAASSNARGYSEQQIESNRFRVSFSGNSLTHQETVENYLLYRAAELTTQRGFDHFIIAERATDKKERFVGSAPHSTRYSRGYRGYFGWSYFRPSYGWGFGYGDPFYDDFDIHQITRFEASAEIVMGRGVKPANNERAYDAREVMNNLAATIKRPEL